MGLRVIRKVLRLRGKRVVMRCDLNVSFLNQRLDSTDLWKLKSVIPTIKFLQKRGASIILVAHRGRPRGVDHELTLLPLMKRLEKMLDTKIRFWKGGVGEAAHEAHTIRRGEIGCLENIRFDAREESNDARLGHALASLGDLYVNDAFANVHRSHASMLSVTRYMPSYAGLLMEYEVKNLSNLLNTAQRPIVAVVGGNKISTKIGLLKKLIRKVDYVLLGGSLANNVLAAMSHNVGKSKIERDMIEWSKGLLSNKLKVPVDARVANSFSVAPRIAPVGRVASDEMILDLGPDTIELYEHIILPARTIIWNGPLGYFEDPRYAQSTNSLVRILMNVRAKSYVGGGETVKAVLSQGGEHDIHFISTGGGAMLELLENKPIPSLRALMTK